MKILAVCADIHPDRIGGAEAHFVEVLKRIAPKLEKVTVLVGDNTGIKNLFLQNNNLEFVRVHYPHIPNLYGLLYILFATPIALMLAFKNKYDLVWAKQEFPQAQVGAVVKLLTKTPLYITSQNPKLGTEELIGIGGGLVAIFVSAAFRVANTVAAVSSYSANLAKKMGAKRVVIIPNGVTC